MKKGQKVFVRTITMYYTGEIVRLEKLWLVLKDAAWVFDTGRFSEAMEGGSLVEVEPYPSGEIRVALSAIVDVSPWNHPLPRKVM